MLFFLVLLSLQALKVDAGVEMEDLNCTTMTNNEIVLSPLSTICNDLLDLAECQQLFGGTTPDPGAVVRQPAYMSRPRGCYMTNNGATMSAGIKAAAIAYCPKYCGFCCLTPEYNCRDSANRTLDCSRVTQSMCKDPLWKDIISTDCPSACGFCQVGGCKDEVTDCDSQPSICTAPAFADFALKNCKRTCGLC